MEDIFEARNVQRVDYQDRQIVIVGTAHVSKKSVEQVREVIQTLKPDTVCVELDQLRYDTVIDESRWRNLDLFAILRQGRFLFFLASLALSSFQRRLGQKLGVKPGAELIEAVKQAESVSATLVLADRDVQATLKRTWANLSLWNKLQLISTLFAVAFSSEEISEAQVEELKDRDAISEMLREFAKQMPAIQKPLIDERDRYLISKVRQAPGKSIVAVVGAGHVEGMIRYLNEPVDCAELEKIPSPTLLGRSIKWVIPTVVLGAFYYGYVKHSGQGLSEMIYAWVIPNSVAAALFCIAVGAKPLTILVAFIGSPITSLNPTIGTGMFAGLSEAWFRKPKVADFETVGDDAMTVRGMFSNPVTRVLIVAAAASVGSSLGAWIGASWVVTLL